MSSRLNQIQNWPELAKQAKWSASVLANLCGVSERTLRRHFVKEMGRRPKEWLAELQQRHAQELLFDGSSIKEISAFLGYKQQTNFTRKYKRQWGICPSAKQTNASNSSEVHK